MMVEKEEDTASSMLICILQFRSKSHEDTDSSNLVCGDVSRAAN